MATDPARFHRGLPIAAGAVLVAMALAVGCDSGERIVGRDDSAGPTTSVIVSDPAGATPVTAQRIDLSFSSAAEGELAYVSLPPGSFPGGGLATVRNGRTGASVRAAMADGGFDPVAIQAAAGDTLELSVQMAGGGGTVSSFLIVPATRRPRVVRTDPPPRKRDVPLNSSIIVVFSEPVRTGTLTGIVLLRGGSPVSGRASLAADGLRAEFSPDALLAPNTEYTLSISTAVTDLRGSPLEAPVQSVFTTGTGIIVASVATDPVALLRFESGVLRTFAMRATLDDKGIVAGSFNIYYPESGHRIFGRIVCFTIVDGSKAWLSGIIEASGNPDAIGLEAKWRTADNGPLESGVPDELSLVYPGDLGDTYGTAEEFCENTPVRNTEGEEMTLHPLLSGNVVVNPSGGPPPPAVSGLSEIAFAAWPDGGIQVIRADGTGGRLLTSDADWNPVWSPDGMRIAFDRRDQRFGGDIYVIRADGTGLTQLTSGEPNDIEPEWSPDGRLIAFSRDGMIHIMNADGSNVVARTAGGSDAHPTWSPDGARLAFTSSRSGPNAVYVMNADGSGIRQLTSGPDHYPRWSPDGTTIAFERNHSGPIAVHLIAPDGTGLTRLTQGGRTPSWSRDGRRIVFEYYGMTSIRVDGSGMMFLGPGFDPAWSPEGDLPPLPQPSVSMQKAGGDAQTGPVGMPLPEPLRVRVRRDDGSPASGVNVAWFLYLAGQPGQPSLSSHFARTDSTGIASVTLTLGSSPGPLTVQVAIRDGTSHDPGVEFTATATDPGAP